MIRGNLHKIIHHNHIAWTASVSVAVLLCLFSCVLVILYQSCCEPVSHRQNITPQKRPILINCIGTFMSSYLRHVC